MTHTTSFRLAPTAAKAVMAFAMTCAAALPSFAAGFERGPAPTKATVSADRGPFEISTYKITRTAAKPFEYGGATIYYPKSGTQTFGLVSVMPGFLATQAQYTTLSQRLASHGFVVVSLDPSNIFDQPDKRAKSMLGAQKQAIELAQGGAPYKAVMDSSRRGVVGHSMGGGGVLSAAALDPALKAAVPLTPWHTTKNFATVKVPTLVVACLNDNIAGNAQHSYPFYASLSPTLPRGLMELKNADHLCAITLAPADDQLDIAKTTVTWLKRFVDEDMRYDALVKGGLNGPEYSRFEVTGF
jgi:hypothetical protein